MPTLDHFGPAQESWAYCGSLWFGFLNFLGPKHISLCKAMMSSGIHSMNSSGLNSGYTVHNPVLALSHGFFIFSVFMQFLVWGEDDGW